MKVSKILISALLSASLIGSAMAAESSSVSTDKLTSKAGDSVVTLINSCPATVDVSYTFKPTGASGVDRYPPPPSAGRAYIIRYPDQLVCFNNLAGGPCYSSGNFEIYCSSANGEPELKAITK